MTVELKPADQRVIDQALHLGAYHDCGEVISAALEMLAEDLDDVAVSKAREQEPRSTLAELEEELARKEVDITRIAHRREVY